MRLILTLVLTVLLLTTSCTGASSQAQPDCDVPKSGRVLVACDGGGSVVISLGARDGVRPGDTLSVMRDGQRVIGIVLHEVKDTQAVGTAIGGSARGAVVPGDTVVED